MFARYRIDPGGVFPASTNTIMGLGTVGPTPSSYAAISSVDTGFVGDDATSRSAVAPGISPVVVRGMMLR